MGRVASMLLLQPHEDFTFVVSSIPKIKDVLGGEVVEHKFGLWAKLRVSCWGLADPLLPGTLPNLALPTLEVCECGKPHLTAVFGGVVWAAVTDSGRATDLALWQVSVIRDFVESLPRSDEVIARKIMPFKRNLNLLRECSRFGKENAELN